jgi:enediyne biosynthesis protein E3
VTILRQSIKEILKISLEETNFERRGFYQNNSQIQQHLEKVGHTFLLGYHAAIKDEGLKALEFELNQVELELSGFAFEGAGMGLALLDILTPWKKKRLQLYLEGFGSSHIYMIHIGIGWVLARLHRGIEKALEQLDPLLGWLAIDGYGFHEGYFHWRQYINNKQVPRAISGYAYRVFDQGLGRSLWFVKGADIHQILETIANFSKERHADLWSGVGLACAYAGGVDSSAIESLREAAQSYQPQLAQGAAFAAKARQRAGNSAKHTELACEILCGLSAATAAEVTDAALAQILPNAAEPMYEVWRRRIQAQFTQEIQV